MEVVLGKLFTNPFPKTIHACWKGDFVTLISLDYFHISLIIQIPSVVHCKSFLATYWKRQWQDLTLVKYFALFLLQYFKWQHFRESHTSPVSITIAQLQVKTVRTTKITTYFVKIDFDRHWCMWRVTRCTQSTYSR